MTSVLARNCLSVVLAVLAMISITNLGLKITSYNFISDYSSLGFNLNPHGNDSGRPTFALPYHLYTSALNLVVASSVFSLLAALIVWISTLCAWTDRKRKRVLPPHRVYLVIHLNTLFSLITLIYTLTTHTRSAHFNPRSIDDYGDGSSYYNGTFDLETWTCEMAKAVDPEYMYSPQCQIERAGRGMLIMGFIISLVASGMAVWALKGERRRWQAGIEMKKMRNRWFDEDDEGDGNGWD